MLSLVGQKKIYKTLASLLVSSVFVYDLALATPELGQIVNGQVNINHSQADSIYIDQLSERAIIEWQHFNIAQHETVNFQQPTNGICLNRINASHGASEIYGRINSNATIALVNQAGIIFGPSAQINVGNLAASTADIANENFIQGIYKFDRPSAHHGMVINHGKIKAKHKGLVALIGNKVQNDGSIKANAGKVLLAAGKQTVIDFYGDGLISFSVSEIPTNISNVLVSNEDLHNVLDDSINKHGLVATEVHNENGNIIFSNGTIDVSANNNAGQVLISGQDVIVGKQATINADAKMSGNGGKIIAQAEKNIDFSGNVSALGGENSGNGGFLEVSGKQNLIYNGTAKLTAANGLTGTLLLDPQFLVVATAGGSAYSAGNNNLYANNIGATNTLTPASIVAAFVGANVVLQANTDVTFTDPVTSGTAARTLTVNAGRSILINANVSTSNGAISMTANDSTAISSDRLAGAGNITMAGGTSLSAGTGAINLIIDPLATSPFSPGNISLASLSGAAISLSTPNAVNGASNIAATGGLTVNVGTASELSGIISGSTVTKQGVGTLTLSGTNTYTGLTTVSAGTLSVTNNSGLGTIAAGTTVVNGATLDLNNVAITTEALTLNGDGVGGVGALTGNGVSSLSGAVTLGSSTTIGGSGTLTLTGIIADGTSTFNVTKAGSGTLVLGAANTYDGMTIINQGILRAGIANTIASTNMLSLANVAGVSFDLNNFSQTVGNLSGGGSLGGNITLGSGTLRVTQGLIGTYDGVISGSGGLTKNGIGSLSLGGINLYTGTTTLNAGILKTNIANSIANSGALTIANVSGTMFDLNNTNQTIGSLSGGGTTGGEIVLGSGNLTINQAATLTYTGIITGSGGITKNGSGTLSLAGLNTYTGPTTINLGILGTTVANSIQFSSNLNLTDAATAEFQLNNTNQIVNNISGGGAAGGNITLGSGILTINQNTTGTYDGVISGTGGITKAGSADLNLTRASTYTGATVINAGVLRPGLANAFNVASTLTLANNSNAIFDLNNFSQSMGRLSGGGSLGGNINLGSATLTINQGSAATYSGIISGTGGIIKAGVAALFLGGVNTYTGSTVINVGTVQPIIDNVIASSNALSMSAINASTFSLNGTNQTIGSLSGGGATTIGAINLGSGMLTINQTAPGTYNGVISGVGGITKAGAAILNINRATTYTGPTMINAGTLQAGIANVISASNRLTIANNSNTAFDLNSLAQGVITLSGGGTNGGNITLGSALLTITQNLAGSYSGIISGTGGVSKAGAAALSLGGVNTYTGTTTINAGELIALNNNVIANSAALTFANTDGAILNLNNTNQTIGSLSGGGTSGGNIILGSGNLAINQTAALTYAGIISGSGGITKNGTGTLSLSALNTYTAPTTINLGILQPTVANIIANTSDLIMADVATAAFNLNNLAQTVGNISGGGANGGNITLGSAVLTVNQNTAATYDGIMSGTGGLTKNGTATLTLSRPNTYTGNTTINNGILRAGVVNAIANSAQVNFANAAGVSFDLNNLAQTLGRLSGGGTLGGNITLGSANLTVNQATSATIYSGIISGTGGLIKTGATALNLNSINTYTGPTTISAGTLQPVINNTIANSSELIMANVATAIFNLNNTNQTINNLSGGGATGGNIALGTGTLSINQSVSGVYDGIISGPGNIIKTGANTLFLNRASTYTGNTTINAGIISINADANIGAAPGAAIAGKLVLDGGTLRTGASFTLNANRGITLGTNGGTILVDPTFTLTYNGIMAGTGSLTKTGTSTLSLGGVNTYTGPTLINAGTIQTTVANSIANTSALVLADVSGAGFNLNNTNQTVGSLSGGGASGGNITLGSGTLTVNQTAANTYAGFITGTGGLTLSNTSNNILTLTNAGNSYTGNTNINGGSLSISADGNLGVAPGVATPGKLAFNGGVLITDGSFNLNSNRGIALNSSGGTINVTNGNTVNYNGIMAGAGQFSKSGQGKLNLGGVNTYTGSTVVNAGILGLTNASSLGASSGTNVISGGSIELDFSGTLANSNAITLNGTNGIILTGNNITLNNPITVNSSSSITGAGLGVMTFGGAINGTADLDFNLTNAGIVLPAVNLTNGADLSVSTNGPITQTGILSISGTSAFSAGANPITLTQNNNFTGSVSVNNTGNNNVNVVNSTGLILGQSSVGSNLNLTSGGSITQSGALNAPNGIVTLAVTNPGSDILLNQANNLGANAPVYAGTLSNIRDIFLRNISSSATMPSFAGLTNLRNVSLTFDQGNILLSNLTIPGALTLIGNSADGSLNVGALSLGTNFANLTGFVAGLFGQAAIDIITLLNTITSGTHYFDGIDMFIGTQTFNNTVQTLYGELYYDWANINNYMWQQITMGRRCKIVGDKITICNGSIKTIAGR